VKLGKAFDERQLKMNAGISEIQNGQGRSEAVSE